MNDRRMLNVACRLLSGVDWQLLQSANCPEFPLAENAPDRFSLSAETDAWSDECSGPLDASGGPALTTVQRRSLWEAIRLARLGDPRKAELALLRLFLRP